VLLPGIASRPVRDVTVFPILWRQALQGQGGTVLKIAPKLLVAAIAVAAFSGVLAAEAVGPTATTPVELCIAKNGSVRMPTTNSPCTSKETAFRAASPDDVASLAARMDADDSDDTATNSTVAGFEATIAELTTSNALLAERYSALAEEFAQLKDKVESIFGYIHIFSDPDSDGTYYVDIRAVRLEPGSTVTFHGTAFGGPLVSDIGVVAADGTFRRRMGSMDCRIVTNVFVTGVGAFPTGDPIQSNTIPTGPNCGQGPLG